MARPNYPRLSAATLPGLPVTVRRPRQDRAILRGGILHFGPGAFHRVHQAWYAERWIESDPRWGIVAVSLQSAALRDALAPQDGLYTLAALDREERWEVIGSLCECRVAAESPGAVLARCAHPDTHLVTLTVTEKGYCLDGEGLLDFAHPDIRADLAAPSAPRSAIGYLVEGLRVRREAGLGPVPVVSCDNLAGNGMLLRSAVMALAGRRDADLAAWIGGEVPFPCTMVDSITPATTDALRERAQRVTGCTDAWPVQREAFLQWVVEGHTASVSPDWAAAGVTLTDDVSGFERAKLRLLNGAHSTLAYAGLLLGHETVAGAMQDSRLVQLVRDLMILDVLPTLQAPRGLDLREYIESILGRFCNPAIRHELAQIAWDGSKKLPMRILPTIRDAVACGAPLERLCVPLAAWMHFVRRRVAAGIALVDPLAATLATVACATSGDPQTDVAAFLSLGAVFPAEFAADPQFRRALESAYRRAGAWPDGPLT